MKNLILQQQIASNPQNSSWVFASAGSGKTKILINRLLRLLISGVAPNKILCLTFTKNAASEMQNRIQESLAKWVSYSDDDLIKDIRNLGDNNLQKNELIKIRSIFFKMIDCNEKIRIMTIHSFCQSLLKIFPFEAKINPNFEILEESSKNILIKKASEIAIKEIVKNISNNNPIKEIFQNHGQDEIYQAVENLIKDKEDLEILKDRFFDIKNIINQIYKKFSVDSHQKIDDLLQDFRKKILENNLKILQDLLTNSDLQKDLRLVETANKFLENPNFINFNNYREIFFDKEDLLKKPSSTISKNAELLNIYNAQSSIINEFEDRIKSIKICSNSAAILQFSDMILEKYNVLKNKDALLDYQDLIIITNRILQNSEFSSWVKMKMDSTYEHILIDESQDTNLKQWQIIKALTEDFFAGIGASENDRSLFVVGDEKQSIYSFQGAQADISSRIFEYYSNQSSQINKIELNNSFRSSINILKAVDAVFSNIRYGSAISKTNSYQNHNPIRDYFGKVEIWPQIENNKNLKNTKDYNWQLPFLQKIDDFDAKEKLARYIAIKIKHEVISKKILSNNRQVNYGDYMILLRNKTNGFDKELGKYFKKFSIPFSSQSRLKFSESLAIQDILSIAIFVTTPFDNLNLAALLKSPIFGLSDNNLLEIINYNKKSDIFENLKDLIKYQKIYSDLIYLKNLSNKLNAFDFYYLILNQKYFKESYLNYFGKQIDQIFDKFLNILHSFCKNKSNQLQKFIEFSKLADPEISLKSLDTNSVKILTIHSAKGLQAPIVFIPDCCFNNNRQQKDQISWIDDEFNLPIWCAKKDWQNNIVKNHAQILQNQASEENLRLLYVAMTRAEDELYIAGFGNDKNSQSWHNIIKESLPGNFKENILKDLDLLSDSISQLDDKELQMDNKYKNYSAKNFDNFVNLELDQDINIGQIRGTLIHQLIEFIIKNRQFSNDWLKDKVNKIITNITIIDQILKKDILSKVYNFLDSNFFTDLIKKNVKSEFELAFNGQIYRIDLMIEEDDKLIIIDYKSDQKIPATIPEKYQIQLQNYQKIITKLYPNYKVECGIFWLEEVNLQIMP